MRQAVSRLRGRTFVDSQRRRTEDQQTIHAENFTVCKKAKYPTLQNAPYPNKIALHSYRVI